jgi:predicted DNA-binding transcriptional regulator YafY
VKFRYRRADGAESERTVRPLGLFFWGTKWTLATWCEYRGDYRSFRPDRMRGLELLRDVFDDSDGVSLAGFMAEVERRARSEGWGPELS